MPAEGEAVAWEPQIHLHYGDVADPTGILNLIARIRPDEIYHLAAQSHVAVSFESPELTADVTGLGTLRILEAIRHLGLQDTTRFYQASTSELFGSSPPPQSEATPFAPRSPYAVAKLYAYWTTANYREAFGIHASNGILFNHESPRRGGTFVTRKISRAVADIHHGRLSELHLGNLDAIRDWGHAKDYVDAMWRMTVADKPGDFVIATGEGHTVREFVDAAFAVIGTTIEWRGKGLEEVGVDASSGTVRVRIDPRYYRPLEVDRLIGDPSKAKAELGWSPSITFPDLVREMVTR